MLMQPPSRRWEPNYLVTVFRGNIRNIIVVDVGKNKMKIIGSMTVLETIAQRFGGDRNFVG